jgi:hypothetical protein
MTRTFFKILFFCFLAQLQISSVFGQDIGMLGKQKPVTLNGSVQLTGIFYDATGIADRRTPYSYIFSGSPVLTIYGLALPLNFAVSPETQTVQQPFNQFGISPQYKWVTVHLGYRNITFSPYTLAGYTMLGAGIELNPGKLHVGFMYGRLNKGTKLDTTTQSLVPYSFTRKAYAGKLGYGTANNFFELSFLKGKDDPTSGPGKIDSLTQLVLPQANTVGGASTRITFFKKLFFEGNIGLSIFTRDINSPIKVDSTNNLIKLAEKVAIVNGTSEYYTAYDAGAGYKTQTFQFKFQYTHIDPDFKSFGAYFFDNDVERYSFAPSFSIFKHRVRFNGNIGFQHDNLKNQKEATTHKIISNAALSADFTPKLGIDINYTNFSNNQQPNTIVFADSLKIAQTTQNISITPHLYIINKITSNTIILGTNIMSLNDYSGNYSQNAPSRNINSNQYFINYTYGYLPAFFNTYINLNMVMLSASGITDKNTGFTVGASKTFFKTLRVSASGGLSKDVRNDGEANVFTSTGNVQYLVKKHQTFGLLYFYTNNQPKNTLSLYPAFVEKRVELSYNYNF